MEGLDGSATVHRDGQSSGDANGLLAGGDNTIQLPFIELNILTANTAYPIHDDQGLRGDSVDQFGKGLELTQDTSGGVDVSDSQQLVFLLLQGLLDLRELRS